MELSNEVKEQIKTHRLQALERRHFELELDRISLEAIGNIGDLQIVRRRMEDVKKAYSVLKSTDVNQLPLIE